MNIETGKDPNQLFSAFAGQEVELVPADSNVLSGSDSWYLPDKYHPTLSAMEAKAKDNGFELRLLWPGSIATDDYRPDRVNVWLERDDQGTWRIGDKFSVG